MADCASESTKDDDDFYIDTEPKEVVSSRIGACEMCSGKDALYTCPRCELKTCSLRCSREHRKKYECNGIRDRTKFIGVKNFSNLDLLSDYRFLEEAARVAASCHKDKTRLVTRQGPGPQLPVHLHRLKGAARQRGILLRFLPQLFSKHKNNTTRFNWRKQFITWKITWNFVHVDRTFHSNKVHENTKLFEALAPFLENPEYEKTLESYQAAGFTGVHVLMKAEGRRDVGGKYFEMDVKRSLKANLKGKLVVEHPVFLVITSQHFHSFDVVPDDSDENPVMDWDGPKFEPERDDSPPPPPAEEEEEEKDVKFSVPSSSTAVTAPAAEPDAEFERVYSEYYKEYLDHYMKSFDVRDPGNLPTELQDRAQWYQRKSDPPKVQWHLGKRASPGGRAGGSEGNTSSALVAYSSGEESDGEIKMPRLEDPNIETGEGDCVGVKNVQSAPETGRPA